MGGIVGETKYTYNDENFILVKGPKDEIMNALENMRLKEEFKVRSFYFAYVHLITIAKGTKLLDYFERDSNTDKYYHKEIRIGNETYFKFKFDCNAKTKIGRNPFCEAIKAIGGCYNNMRMDFVNTETGQEVNIFNKNPTKKDLADFGKRLFDTLTMKDKKYFEKHASVLVSLKNNKDDICLIPANHNFRENDESIVYMTGIKQHRVDPQDNPCLKKQNHMQRKGRRRLLNNGHGSAAS
jgi:hypothetical protein